MSSRDQINNVLAQLLAQGCSAPIGKYWQPFYLWLKVHGQHRSDEPPPVPLILAASGCSNAMKQQRLGEQLEWAAKASILMEAFEQLRAVPVDGWSRGPLEKWHMEKEWPSACE